MFLKNIGIVILISNFFAITGISQGNRDIRVKALTRKNYVILRWAPTNSTTWLFSKDYGYGIERYTLVRDGKFLNKPEKKVLTNAPLKPASQKVWESEYLKKQDDFLAVAAQSYYGTNFQVIGNKSGLMDMVNKAKEQDNRFGFALVAADRNGIVARLSGLRYVDSTVKSNERYLYRVFSYIPIEKLKTDTGFVFVNIEKPSEFPKFRELNAAVDKKQITLTWSSFAVSDYYSAYIIERSADEGKTWKQVNSKPYVNLSPDGSVPENYKYIDTIPDFNNFYTYRIAGTTIFDENGAYSPTVRVKGKQRLPESPKITSVTEMENKEVHITWEFPEHLNTLVSGFHLEVAPNIEGPYKAISKVTPDVRRFVYKGAGPSNYFVIKAITKDTLIHSSYPVLFQPNDETPPATPENVKVFIDTTGLVTISWNKNKEPDIAAYHLLFSNSRTEEFSNTFPIIRDTVYSYRIPLITLTEKIYYKVIALDFRGNPSIPTHAIEAKKPDIVPPTSPLFADYRISDSTVYLKWIHSTSEDVVNHVLFRSIAGSSEWKVIALFDKNKNDSVFYDKTLERGIYYDYAIVAVDDSKNESPFGQTIRAKLADEGLRDQVKNFKASPDRTQKAIQLSWEYPQAEGVRNFILYRKENAEPFQKYKYVEGSKRLFTDKSLKIETKYSYLLKAEHADGGASPFSKELSVDY